MNLLRRYVPIVVVAVLAAGCDTEPVEPVGGASAPVAVGDRAPAFTLPAADGSDVSLADFGGRPVLLYFSMGPG
jgi:peroxiredoxin Q/BCP